MQVVLFSWLVVGELGAAPGLVGVVQMARVVPLLLLLLPGGATADRFERRWMLMLLHAAAGLLTALLAAAVVTGALSIPVVVAYAISVGVITSFVMPARDALLNDVVRGDLMRAVTAVTLAQFGGQALGTLAAGAARFLGLGPTLGIQALLLFAGIATAWALPASRAALAGEHRISGSQVLEGLAEVARSPTMRSTMLLMTGVGLFLGGAYFVVVPILIRDHYRGDVAQLSFFMTTLLVGTVLGAAAMLMARRLPRRGPVLALSLGASALPLLGLALGLPFPLALAAAFFWGLCVAAFNSVGRGLMQESAPAPHRARVLSVFTLGITGAGVLSAPISGLLAEWLGPLGALAVGGGALLVFVAVVSLVTRIARID
jgi:MFS family permease